MSAEPKILRGLDTDIEADHNSWTKPPDGVLLLIEESPNHELLIDDEGNRLLIQ